MPKKFFTERDIEDLAAGGQFTLTVSEDVVLTELAFEKAERLGVKLVQPHQTPPAAPVRPYLSEEQQPAAKPPSPPAGTPAPTAPSGDEDLRQRIRAAVKAKLGDQIDDALLEAIITRVLNNVGVS
jgi:hypothetical protein